MARSGTTATTLAAALRGAARLSPGAAADYGYLRNLYKTPPSSSQMQLLTAVYALALELHGEAWLHERLVARELRATLSSLTDHAHDFRWLALCNE